MNHFEKANVPERAYVDLMQLVRASTYRPDFMQAEVHDIAQIVEHISHRVGCSFGALGLKMPSAKISDDAKILCKCHINLPLFSFIVFRMIYTAFRLSVDGTAYMDLEYLHTDKADVCVYVRTAIDAEQIQPNDFVSLIKLLPEFALEFTMLQKIGILGKSLSFSFEDSILKLHYQTKCAHSDQLTMRSDRPERKMELIAALVTRLIAQTKDLLSKNQPKTHE